MIKTLWSSRQKWKSIKTNVSGRRNCWWHSYKPAGRLSSGFGNFGHNGFKIVSFIKLKNLSNLPFCSRWRKTQKQSELSPKWLLGWQNTRNENWQIQNLGWRNTRHEIWPQIQNPPWWQNTWKKMPFFEKYKIYQFWLLMLWTSN